MKKRITGAKIACLDINLQKARMQLGVQILVDDPEQLEDIRKRYVRIATVMGDTFLLPPDIANRRSLLSASARSSLLGPTLS